MVQSSDLRNRDDLSHFSRFDRPLFGSVILESEVRSVFVVVRALAGRRFKGLQKQALLP
jgi:hypothetical protein